MNSPSLSSLFELSETLLWIDPPEDFLQIDVEYAVLNRIPTLRETRRDLVSQKFEHSTKTWKPGEEWVANKEWRLRILNLQQKGWRILHPFWANKPIEDITDAHLSRALYKYWDMSKASSRKPLLDSFTCAIYTLVAEALERDLPLPKNVPFKHPIAAGGQVTSDGGFIQAPPPRADPVQEFDFGKLGKVKSTEVPSSERAGILEIRDKDD